MKLSLDALKERAGAVASEELLLSITGGRENACHDGLTGILAIDALKGVDKEPVLVPNPGPLH